ncbi:MULTISPECIES: hypothetical protein [Bacteroides]|jgi:hypothetical protein|uniref:Uncharacterized protein n=1 Tax=Bacteroides fragilis TaxID=817 RepID=A0ABD4VPL9_BACFG|nr:hypothetical protein [Bacteroides fragilis]MCZ2653466.1 hypothetical protein [Bacteroides fragilis]
MNTEKFKIEIKKRLQDKFEHDLLDASLQNLVDIHNKLRFNNFAYSLRELTRHILERLAPDEKVLNTAWFIPISPKEPKKVTRKQRMKYAIQGGLPDDYVIDTLEIDVDAIGKKVGDNIDLLSKYTHVNPDSFYVEDDKVKELSEKVMDAVILLFQTIEESRASLTQELEDNVNTTVISNLFYETIDSIDYLATHYNIEDFTIDEITLLDIDDTIVFFKATGDVNVNLQYGSNGDLRRDDGMTMNESFPFTGEFYGRIKDGITTFELETETFEVDTDCHWG